MRSLELSHRQGARAWELRTAIDLAALLAVRGQRRDARTLLRPVFDEFVEGLDWQTSRPPNACCRLWASRSARRN